MTIRTCQCQIKITVPIILQYLQTSYSSLTFILTWQFHTELFTAVTIHQSKML